MEPQKVVKKISPAEDELSQVNEHSVECLTYACLIFICDLQQTTQEDPLVSQIAAEKRAARAEEARAKEARRRAESDDDGTHDDDVDDADVDNGGERATEPESETGKKKKRARVSKKSVKKSEHFAEPGSTHALIRRATPFWNSSDTAVDISDPGSHPERLKGSLAAVQVYNINGLRDQALSIFDKDFMRLGLQQAASSADKVKTILYARRHLTKHVVAFRHRTPPHEILVSLPFILLVCFNAQQLR